MMQIHIVGGFVRDRLLGRISKDVDVVVTEVESFDAMLADIESFGFTVWQSRPEYVTVRAKVREGHWLAEYGNDIDFVMARKEEPGDPRITHPTPGTLEDDLRRRDFTMNAIAWDPRVDYYVDPHGGRQDLHEGTIRSVGNALDRFYEDPIRVLRAIRFISTLDLFPDTDLQLAMENVEIAELVGRLPIERVREEMVRVLHTDTANALEWFMMHSTPELRRAIFRDGLHLVPSLKGNA